jgi:hypothetical protein
MRFWTSYDNIYKNVYVVITVDMVWQSFAVKELGVLWNNTTAAQKLLQHFLYFSQNQQEMTATYSVVNLECSACYCSTAEQSVF